MKAYWKMPVTRLSVLVLSLFSVACSIKEDRSACPCYIYVVVDDFIEAGLDEALVAFSAGGNMDSEQLDLKQYAGSAYKRTLPRTEAKVAAVAGMVNTVLEGDHLVVPYGNEADSLWLYNEIFFCDGDEYRIRAVPGKEFCTLTLIVSGLEEDLAPESTFRVTAACSAIDIFSRTPRAGAYSSIASRNEDGNYVVRIPRQSGYEILLEISVPQPEAGENADLFYSMDIGKKFMEAGYDWDRKDLLDVSAVVNFNEIDIELSIEEWVPDDSYDDVEI